MAVAEGGFVGQHVRKIFKGHSMFEGIVLAYDPKEHIYNTGYTDGDSEKLCILRFDKQFYPNGNKYI